MKRHWKEIAFSAVQLFMFYIFPLFAGPTDAMGMVLLILIATFVLSAAMGLFSVHRLKLLYPAAAALAFIPSVFIHYNESALIHAAWYFVDSLLGLGIGTLIRSMFRLHK